MSDATSGKLRRVLRECRQRDAPAEHGLSNRRHLLLEGGSGTGKTMTAAVLASELSLPLYTVRADDFFAEDFEDPYGIPMQIFDFIGSNRGVYLFDDFHDLGGGADVSKNEKAREIESPPKGGLSNRIGRYIPVVITIR